MRYLMHRLEQFLLAGRVALLVWLAAPDRSALAHGDQPLAPHDLWSAWSWEPVILLSLAVAGWAYASGVRSLWRRAGRGRGVSVWQAISFAAGLLALFLALISPLDALGEALFSAHMVQHMLLILLAAPFLVFGASPAALAWSLPRRWRVHLGRWWRRQGALQWIWRGVSQPLFVWGLHAAALWFWHLPVLYQQAVVDEAVHALEHASFILTALLFWWMVLYGFERRGLGRGFAILYLFTMAIQSGFLGVLITFAPSSWYPIYQSTTSVWGLTSLEDQQLAGVIMWVPAGVVYLGAALQVLGSWLLQVEREDQARLESTMPGKDRK